MQSEMKDPVLNGQGDSSLLWRVFDFSDFVGTQNGNFNSLAVLTRHGPAARCGLAMTMNHDFAFETA